MINLKTLPEATAQEVFDHVARHLLTQNEKSIVSGLGCAYRGAGGLKCAAGCLIGDDEYHPSWETRSWETLVKDMKAPRDHALLISRLQDVHDRSFGGAGPSTWKGDLVVLAGLHALSTAVLDEFQ